MAEHLSGELGIHGDIDLPMESHDRPAVVPGEISRADDLLSCQICLEFLNQQLALYVDRTEIPAMDLRDKNGWRKELNNFKDNVFFFLGHKPTVIDHWDKEKHDYTGY